jgi:hypothetical protein
MEPAVIFHQLMGEAAEWEDGFTVSTPDPVIPTFIEELRAQHYPWIAEFEVNPTIEILIAEVNGDENNLVYDVVFGTREL